MVIRPFSPDERALLASQRLGRLATVSPDGVVGNAPVTYFVRSDDTIDIGGMRMGATKKFRNVGESAGLVGSVRASHAEVGLGGQQAGGSGSRAPRLTIHHRQGFALNLFAPPDVAGRM